jgi:zinc/manganese transport system substrate-binding protein
MPRLLPLLAALALPATAQVRVATLPPLLSEITTEVGGDRVKVIDLLGPNQDPHHFEPTPAQIAEAGKLDLCLASGAGLEADLKTLASLLPANTRIVEVGNHLPTIEGGCNDPDHHHHHDHEHAADPHWWHSVDLVRRAVGIVEKELATLDPASKSAFATRATDYRKRLDALEIWVRKEIARIPRDRRVLATAHAAFGYFCQEHGFEAFAVQGVNREQMPDAATLAKLIADLQSRSVPVIFPESTSNPKTLEAITTDTGIRLGDSLHADATGAANYEAMMRHNVSAIVKGLR